MTVQEALRAYIGQLCPDMDFPTLERLGVDLDAVGLFQTPKRQEEVFLDGSSDVTDYIDLYARFPSHTDTLRTEALEALQRLCDSLWRNSVTRALPALPDGCVALWIQAEGAPALLAQTDAESVYQLTVRVQYTRP